MLGECRIHGRGADSLSHPGYFLACVPDEGLGELSTSVMESPGQKQRRFVCTHPLNLSHEYQTHALSISQRHTYKTNANISLAPVVQSKDVKPVFTFPALDHWFGCEHDAEGNSCIGNLRILCP